MGNGSSAEITHNQIIMTWDAVCSHVTPQPCAEWHSSPTWQPGPWPRCYEGVPVGTASCDQLCACQAGLKTGTSAKSVPQWCTVETWAQTTGNAGTSWGWGWMRRRGADIWTLLLLVGDLHHRTESSRGPCESHSVLAVVFLCGNGGTGHLFQFQRCGTRVEPQ